MNTITLEIPIPQTDYELIARLAQTRNQSPIEIIGAVTSKFVETLREQEANYTAIEQAQSQYPGEFIAVHQGQILAHANQATTVLETIHAQFGLEASAVLLVKTTSADWQVPHPQLA